MLEFGNDGVAAVDGELNLLLELPQPSFGCGLARVDPATGQGELAAVPAQAARPAGEQDRRLTVVVGHQGQGHNRSPAIFERQSVTLEAGEPAGEEGAQPGRKVPEARIATHFSQRNRRARTRRPARGASG